MTWHDEKEPPVYAAGERAAELEAQAAQAASADKGDTEPSPPPAPPARDVPPVDGFPYVEHALAVGWYCACGIFNGDGKERMLACRSCEAPRPTRGEPAALLLHLLSCEHENVSRFLTGRDGLPAEVCNDCGARRQPESSRPEWMIPEYVAMPRSGHDAAYTESLRRHVEELCGDRDRDALVIADLTRRVQATRAERLEAAEEVVRIARDVECDEGELERALIRYDEIRCKENP